MRLCATVDIHPGTTNWPRANGDSIVRSLALLIWQLSRRYPRLVEHLTCEVNLSRSQGKAYSHAYSTFMPSTRVVGMSNSSLIMLKPEAFGACRGEFKRHSYHVIDGASRSALCPGGILT